MALADVGREPPSLFARKKVNVTVAPTPLMPTNVMTAQRQGNATVAPIVPRQMPAAIAAGRGAPAAQPGIQQTMAPVAYAMEKYKESGNPFTAAAEGWINAQNYREQKAVEEDNRKQAAEFLKDYPDLQQAVTKGVIDFADAQKIAAQRDQTVQAETRRKQIVQSLTDSGDSDLAQQFSSGVIDESTLHDMLKERDKNSKVLSDSGLADLPQVQLDDKGAPSKDQQEAFLAQLDPQDAALVQSIANYEVDATKVLSLRGNERARVVALVKQFDPTFDMSLYTARANMRKAVQTGDMGKNLVSANTLIGHLEELKSAGAELGNTPFTPWNALSQSVTKTFGNPKPTRFDTARQAVADEMAKLFKGNGAASDAEINHWLDQFNSASSQDQIDASINEAIKLMGSRVQAIRSQYDNAMGKPGEFQFINNQSARILKGLGVDPTAIDPDYDPSGKYLAGVRNDGAPPDAGGDQSTATDQGTQQGPTLDPNTDEGKQGYAALKSGDIYYVPGDPTPYVKK